MDEKEYKNIRVYKSTYEQLRELKYLKNKTFIDIIKESINETYNKEKETKNERR